MLPICGVQPFGSSGAVVMEVSFIGVMGIKGHKWKFTYKTIKCASHGMENGTEDTILVVAIKCSTLWVSGTGNKVALS